VPVAGPSPTDDPVASTPDHTVRLHALPKAPLVDRVPHLVDLARNRRVVHVGFVDAGFRETQDKAGAWLHAHLAGVASHLVGLDVDEHGVKQAVAEGYEAYRVDCRDAEAIAALGLEPADLVIAGEVIEHLDDPGGFLEGLQSLVGPGGELVITTPNAYGLFNVLASLTRHEINHPDHVVMFTWQTLTNMAGRHGWTPVATHVYVPSMKEGPTGRALALAGRAAVALERLLARLGRSYAADGLIVRFRSARR
jgi:SAM-dependent methyltransferase